MIAAISEAVAEIIPVLLIVAIVALFAWSRGDEDIEPNK